MTDAENVETPEVSFSLSGDRLTLRDEAGGGEVLVELGGDTSLTRATTSWFDVPMDAAVSFETETLRFPHNTEAVVRDADGESRGVVTDRTFEVDSAGTFIDVSAKMKVCIYVDAGTVSGRLLGDEENPEALFVTLDERRRVTIAVRSAHREPTATMTVPPEPEALMTALSHLGDPIKEWSAERSWPTLRGHPPAIELGSELDIPDAISAPDTKVTVTVPSDIGNLLRVAPLAYYFGAEVVPGDSGMLSVPGHTEHLGVGRELESAVDELVARGLVLDSLVRIGGYYSLPRNEYDEIAPNLPFYPPALYDEPIHRQLLEYLEVSFEQLEPYVPTWPVTAVLRPEFDDAGAVPYLINALARIRVTADGTPRSRPSPSSRFSGVTLSTSASIPSRVAAVPPQSLDTAAEWQTRQAGRTTTVFVGGPPSIGFPAFDSERFKAQAEPAAQYYESVSKATLREVIRTDPLHLHYGNRITENGFVCSDGVLGFDELPDASLGVLSFEWDRPTTTPLLPLSESAVVTCLFPDRLSIATAEQFGTYLAFGAGVATSTVFAGIADNVRFLGDASLPVAERMSGRPLTLVEATPTDDGQYLTRWHVPGSRRDNLGQVVFAYPDATPDAPQLSGTPIQAEHPVPPEKLSEYADGSAVVRLNGGHQNSTETSVESNSVLDTNSN